MLFVISLIVLVYFSICLGIFIALYVTDEYTIGSINGYEILSIILWPFIVRERYRINKKLKDESKIEL